MILALFLLALVADVALGCICGTMGAGSEMTQCCTDNGAVAISYTYCNPSDGWCYANCDLITQNYDCSSNGELSGYHNSGSFCGARFGDSCTKSKRPACDPISCSQSNAVNDGASSTTSSTSSGSSSSTSSSSSSSSSSSGSSWDDEPPELDDDPCFPSTAIVTLANFKPVPISALKEGDQIVAATASGGLTTDTVSLLSIAEADRRASAYTVLSTASNQTITLTGDHHLPVGAHCCSELKKAKDVVVGETLWAAEKEAVVPSVVVKVGLAESAGLHSPVLLRGSFPVVDGLVTSFDDIESVQLAAAGLPALITACNATNTCNLIRRTFMGGASTKYIDA